MLKATLSQIRAQACVPEQLPHYVQAITGRRGIVCGGYAAYLHEGHAVLVAYPGCHGARELAEEPTGQPFDKGAFDAPAGPTKHSLDQALRELKSHGCSSVSVLSPFSPLEAPPEAKKAESRDFYWQLPLPAPVPAGKLKNMLVRAGRDVSLHEERWSGEHEELVGLYLRTRPLPEGTRVLFSSLGSYVNATRGSAATSTEALAQSESKVALLAARKRDESLAAFVVGDFSGLETAFYMFAFRRPDSPPGTADLLLFELARRAEELGHARINLGLGINSGIGFFKKKWGAKPYLPYVETSWQLAVGEPDKSAFKSLIRKILG